MAKSTAPPTLTKTELCRQEVEPNHRYEWIDRDCTTILGDVKHL
eukprot:CAMPEP_0174725998 /NCGR_PEP_ID=MMETSP1094-20130205/46815_1 /TAXON_ID=156173 /ORGANISM="Chrysochromulina brevifilum, Strain UTEX LB 985" /LENGTH=43 /DNA_ID= /DNA_START= /DNA_END= /DNA_ORIENTATION=